MSLSDSTSPPRGARRTPPSPSLAEVAVKRLRQMIVNGHLEPGAALFEPQLGETLKVSRTPVREALKLLAAEGLVELRRNRNAMVARLDDGELADLFELEAGLEGFAAGLAAHRRRPAQLRRLATLQQRMEACHARGDRDAYIRVNQEVHRLIVACAHNAALAEAHARLITRLHRARNLSLATAGRVSEAIEEHREILAALEAGAATHASSLMTRHVARTGELYFARHFAPAGASV